MSKLGVTKSVLIGLTITASTISAVWFLIGSNTDKSTSTDAITHTYQSLSSKASIPVYTTNKTAEYVFNGASTEESGIIISSYTSTKGIINVSQQARPSVDPFGSTAAADTFVTSIGDARIYPDDKSEPYVVLQTPLTWIIVRSNSLNISSADLKEFCLSLREVPSTKSH